MKVLNHGCIRCLRLKPTSLVLIVNLSQPRSNLLLAHWSLCFKDWLLKLSLQYSDLWDLTAREAIFKVFSSTMKITLCTNPVVVLQHHRRLVYHLSPALFSFLSRQNNSFFTLLLIKTFQNLPRWRSIASCERHTRGLFFFFEVRKYKYDREKCDSYSSTSATAAEPAVQMEDK